MVECIYIAASAHDARYTRICVASVRHFYPDVAIKLLAGGPLERGLADELRHYWNVGMVDLPSGDYGWGFVKLEPLFGPRGERFLVLDSDTVMAGPVLGLWSAGDPPFLVDDETQTEADTLRLYYDWRQVSQIDPKAQTPGFVFNSGQWFGTAGILARDDFSPWLEWTMPRQLRYPAIFKQGEQGVLNYIFNQKAAVAVRRRKIMRWPGHGMEGLSAASIADRTATPLVVHWAGMKKPRLSDMTGADLLTFFEKRYFQRLSTGSMRRIVGGSRHTSSEWLRGVQVRVKIRLRRIADAGPGGKRMGSPVERSRQ